MPQTPPWLAVLVAAIPWSVVGLPPARGEDLRASYLLAPSSDPPRHEPYVPAAGDLVFYSNTSRTYRTLYAMARTGPPYHVGIVVSLPDGRPAVLEAAPYYCLRVYLLDALPRLHSYEGDIWVRRLRVPLTADQSARLTAFALGQAGKFFPVFRIALEGTPLGVHRSLGRWLWGSSRVEYPRWFCSELVVAAASVAGLLDPNVIRPNTVFPRDLFTDRPHDLSLWWEPPCRWDDGS